ncbi:MAG: helix-turn-helix transcriptional regulator [Bacteroidaceae bacterium]|nr:helix-turn-helix transcriptional regulator [Bacteroidaceae bacterium]MBR3884455.1 helix-turn-helix transcriptional regulator [Bacteroidaceae bacterium]
MERLQIGIIAEGGRTGQTDFKAYGNNRIGISGCMVLLVDSGCAIVSVGFKRRVLRQGMMAVLFYDDTFWIERSSSTFRCRYVALADDNVQEAIYKLTSPYIWDSLSENPLLRPDNGQWELLESWFEQMVWICHNSANEYTNQLLRNNIYNLFMAMDGEMTQRNAGSNKAISRSRSLIIKFLKLVALHFRTTREVSFYAEQLCITTTYLYKLTHKRWNLSPKELIDKQTICEIKSLLSNTDMSIKEIATALHFEDTPYMCRYFRQRTGVSPMEYRNGIKKP